MSEFLSFKLSDEFVNKYEGVKPDWGFDVGGGNSLSELTFITKYSRLKEDGSKEQWYEVCRRCIEGMYSILKDHCGYQRTPWNEFKAQKAAQDAFDRMFQFKWTPPGRGMWAMGTRFVHEKQSNSSLNNCSFVSTEKLSNHSAYEATMPFTRLMEMSLNGVGVGYDTRGADKLTIYEPSGTPTYWSVPDTREGWAESLGKLLETYFFKNRAPIQFDYSEIRPAGAPLKSFGGTASGPVPLIVLHESIEKQFAGRSGEKITSRDIVDIMNKTAKAVVSGGARRSALISLGSAEDEDYVNIKNWDLPENAERTGPDGWAWTSNNSVVVNEGDDLSHLVDKIALNGEPGIIWLDVMKQYGRLADPINNKDYRVLGSNPCQPAWATVLTPFGIRTIGDLLAGDMIWSETGWTMVTKKWSTGIKDVYAYRTTTGTFYGTENHRVVSNGIKVEAQHAGSIDQLTGFPEDYSDLSIQDVMDGLVVGDGSVHKASNDLVYLYIGENDKDYFDSEVDVLIGRHRPGLTDRAYEVITTILPEELPLLPERVVPGRFFHGNTNQMRGFLRGLYSANGSVVGNGSRVTLKSSNFTLIEQVQTMLSALGIASYYTTNKAKPVDFANGTYVCKESYDLNISTDRREFVNQIGFLQKYKMDKIRQTVRGKSKHSYDIKSVEFVSTEEVFDITVDNDPHTYWTGGVNVSNCAEISLESHEFCNLSELYPIRHETFDDFKKSMKHAYMYVKAVTLMPSTWAETNEVITRNRRIGISMTGVVEFIETRSWFQMQQWMDEGYGYLTAVDNKYSEWLGVRNSIKLTTVKPAGTTSLISGTTSGIHWPTTTGWYIRRLRFHKTDPLIDVIRKAGYHIEDDVNDPNSTVVVEFPTRGLNLRSEREVSIWEKAHLAVMAQRYWADNMVSVTVSFKEEEKEEIAPLLRSLQGQLKSISFLPITESGTSYAQAPYEPISEELALKQMKKIKPIDVSALYKTGNDTQGEQFCTNDSCEIKF